MDGAPLPNDIHREFLDYLQSDGIRRTNFEGKVFYFPKQISRWLLQKGSNTISSRAAGLFSAIYDNRESSTGKFFPTLKDRDVERDPILFAILVQMECGHMLHIFRNSIADNHLGFHNLSHLYTDIEQALKEDKVTLPNRYKSAGYAGVTADFERQRWAFHPALNVLDMTEAGIEGKSILPFFHREIINEGGTAEVHHHKIHVDLVESDNLRQILEPRRQDHKTGMEYYEFAVKTYRKGFDDIYKLESDAFKAFNGTQNPRSLGVVTYLGEYTRHDRGDDGVSAPGVTRHIMLEYGEQDLDEYLADTYPPVLNGEIIAFWETLFRIANTLARIHQLEHVRGDSIQKYVGWHGDIKPENILRVRGQFKLADFGFTRFEKNTFREHQTTHLLGGTRTYGAPERDASKGEDKILVTTTIDTWSLGCVFSSAATWVVLGAQAYENYGEMRAMAQERLQERRKEDSAVHVPPCSDAFHDGVEVLPAVLQWHDYLRDSLRKADTITGMVLDLVESDMLEKDPEKRLSSASLCKRLNGILIEAKHAYRDALDSRWLKPQSQEIVGALLELDKRASRFAQPRSPTTIDGRDKGETIWTANNRHSNSRLSVVRSSRVRKSERIDKILRGKINNREEVIQSDLNPGPIFELPADERNMRAGGVTKNPSQTLETTHNNQTNRFRATFPSAQVTVRQEYDQSIPRINNSVPDPEISGGKLEEAPHSATGEIPEWRSESNDPRTGYSARAGDLYDEDRHSQTKDQNSAVLASTPMRFRARREIPIVQEYDRLHATWNKSNKWYALQRDVPQDGFLAQFIDNRHIIFVVDNAASMSYHWADVTTTLLALAMKIGKLDRNGLDLKFTIGEKHNVASVKNWKIPKQFSKSLESAARTMDWRNKTNMATALTKIFDDYGKYDKKQTLIILTDALWEASEDENDVENAIDNLIKSLEGKANKGERGWFTIQFVSFGSDERALERLRRLDDDFGRLAEEGVVDWKPWDSADPGLLITGSIGSRFKRQSAAQEMILQAPAPPHASQSSTPNSRSKTRRLSGKIIRFVDRISTKEAKEPQGTSTASSTAAHTGVGLGDLVTVSNRQMPSMPLHEYDVAPKLPTYNEYTNGMKDQSARLEGLRLDVLRLKSTKHNNTKLDSSQKEEPTNKRHTPDGPKRKASQLDNDASHLVDVYYVLQPLWRVSSVITDAWKRGIETIAGSQLSWWPLADPERAPKPGLTRIYSVVFSEPSLINRRFYDDIPTSSAQRLFPRLLNSSHLPLPTGLQALGNQAVILRETTLMQVLNQTRSRGDGKTSPVPELVHPHRAERQFNTENTPRGVDSTYSEGEIFASEDQESGQRWTEESVEGSRQEMQRSKVMLYLTANIGREESVACAVKTGDNDQQTLHSLQTAFRSLPSSRWKVATGVKFYRFRSFHFRQQLKRCSVIIHEDKERYPREVDPEYQNYQYTPRPWEDDHELPCLSGEAWYFYNNQDECGTSVQLNGSFPKRLDESPGSRFTGWSIHIQQRYSILVILIPVLGVTIITLASTMWFIPSWLGKHADDLQNATVPVMLALTTVQFMIQLLVSLLIFRWSL